MALIDYKYFVNAINIPGTGREEVAVPLKQLIAVYEPELLRELLGVALYNKIAGPTAADEPYSSIIGGTTYSVNEVSYYWEGLRQPSLHTSLIANYVFYRWAEQNFSSMTGTGAEAVAKLENAQVVSPNRRMINAWNAMADSVENLYKYLDYLALEEWTGRNGKGVARLNLLGI